MTTTHLKLLLLMVEILALILKVILIILTQ